MGKRYYCDYCDKSFADNPVNRKLHLTGGVHLRNKKAHYEAAKDEHEILADDAQKKPCHSFMSSGECRFGERCQYSHLTVETKAKIARKLGRRKKTADRKEEERRKTIIGLSEVLDKWLEKRSSEKEKLQLQESGKDTENEEGQAGTSAAGQKGPHVPDYQVAEFLSSFHPIPPSLLSPTREAILNAEYSDWT